ncbi:penicillin-binding transpeptidase domain-containing protein [Candidatus Cloacimonadota bacterium]
MRTRLRIFIVINTIFLLIWVIYLFSLQLLDPHNFKDTIAIRQNPSKNLIIPNRGNIYDRNGQLLVSSIKYYQIDLDKKLIKKFSEQKEDLELTEICDKIAGIVADNSQENRSSLYRKIMNSSSSVLLSKQISESQLIKIKEAFKQNNYPGLVTNFSLLKRSYPQEKLAASLLGMAKSNKDALDYDPGSNFYQLKGLSGLEATFDEELAGKFGWQETINDANNKRIPFLFLKERKAQNGNSLILTLDSNIQEILEENLRKGLKKFSARHAIGVIMDPNSGEVLAMSGIADEDENRSASYLRSLTNLSTGFMFEPGSTLKPITALLALENNIYKPDDLIECKKYLIDNRIIRDSHEHSHLNFRDIIAYSSNVGISKIVEKVGHEKLYDRMIAMGFGQKTGSNLAGEASGIFRKLKDWQGYSLHSISFGQEISVTALQLAKAYSCFANGGNVMQPYFVKEIRDENNKVIKEFKPRKIRKISDSESLDTLKVFLKNVVDYGTATLTHLEHIDIAGKTGTAEKIIKGELEYSKDKYTSVFAGFFPYDEPRYVMVILFDEPDYTYHFASLSAVPTFKDIVVSMLNRPDNTLITDLKEKNITYTIMPDLMGKTQIEVRDILQKKKIEFNIITSSEDALVINQYPQPEVKFDQSQKVIVILDKEEVQPEEEVLDYVMPDLLGLTVRSALNSAFRRNIKLAVKGTGLVSTQSIPAGTKIDYGERCIVIAK